MEPTLGIAALESCSNAQKAGQVFESAMKIKLLVLGSGFFVQKFSPSLEKCVGHSSKLLDIVQKIWALSENSSPHLVSQLGYEPVVPCPLKIFLVFFVQPSFHYKHESKNSL